MIDKLVKEKNSQGWPWVPTHNTAKQMIDR
jgi:hypothetical protein